VRCTASQRGRAAELNLRKNFLKNLSGVAPEGVCPRATPPGVRVLAPDFRSGPNARESRMYIYGKRPHQQVCKEQAIEAYKTSHQEVLSFTHNA